LKFNIFSFCNISALFGKFISITYEVKTFFRLNFTFWQRPLTTKNLHKNSSFIRNVKREDKQFFVGIWKKAETEETF